MRVGVGLGVLGGGVGVGLGVLGGGVGRDVLSAWFALALPLCVSLLRPCLSAFLTTLAAPTVNITGSLGAALSPSFLSIRTFSSSFFC